MKTKLILFPALLLSPLLLFAETGGWQKDYESVLKKYCVDGGVRYADWKANAGDMAALENVTEAIGRENPRSLSRNEQLAFYINAYNAWAIRLVLEKYPIKSVRDYAPLFGMFTGKHIRLGGEKLSLNHLEKEIVLKGFKEPRVHFALNCASQSCPPLIPDAYEGRALDKQLNERTRSFTLNPLGVQLSRDKKTAKLSSIFKWYADDFKEAGGAVAFINKFRPEPIPADARIDFQEYDWSLNDRR